MDTWSVLLSSDDACFHVCKAKTRWLHIIPLWLDNFFYQLCIDVRKSGQGPRKIVGFGLNQKTISPNLLSCFCFEFLMRIKITDLRAKAEKNIRWRKRNIFNTRNHIFFTNIWKDNWILVVNTKVFFKLNENNAFNQKLNLCDILLIFWSF